MQNCPTCQHGLRRAAVLQNEHLRLTVLREGGHIAEILDKLKTLNPQGALEGVVARVCARPARGPDARARGSVF